MQQRSLVWLAVAGIVLVSSAAEAARPRPITKLTVNPNAEVVALFEAMDQGRLEVKVVPKDQFQSTILIHNISNKPLTVKMPGAVVGVHVLNQPGFPFPPGGNNGNPFGQQQQGGGQTVGGQGQGNNNNIFGNGNNNNGVLFSIPAEKVVKLKMETVCLEYGKPNPISRMNYTLKPVGEFSTNPELKTLLSSRTSATDRMAMQAAAWHLSSGLTWEQLRKLEVTKAAQKVPMFSRKQLQNAQEMVKYVRENTPAAEQPTTPVTTRIRKNNAELIGLKPGR